MELVYLWIKKYQNIEKQGFYFSPSSTYNHEKKSYESIFPENISITVIVGENGSGKTSIIKKIDESNDYKSLLLDNDKLNFNDNFKTILNEDNSCFDFINKNFFFTRYYNYLDCTFRGDLNSKINTKPSNKDDIKKIISLDYFDYIESKFKITPLPYLSSSGDSKNEKELDGDITKLEESLETSSYNEIIEKCNCIIQKAKQYDDIDTNTNEIISITTDDIKKYLELLEFDEEQKIWRTAYITFENKIEENQLFKYLKKRDFIYKSYVNPNYPQYNYQNLSSGEKHLLEVLTDFIHKLEYKEPQAEIILLDEPDIYLHPQWQKEFINLLIKATGKIKKERKIHLVVTTHSPFLLSDLPKENIIFLKEGKQVYPDIETFGANIHTLLSHGFFMDGLMGEFAKGKIDNVINFLNDKKSEIRNNDEAQNIINIIGEPIIKRQLQKMLDSKNIHYIADDVKEEIKSLKEQISTLKKIVKND